MGIFTDQRHDHSKQELVDVLGRRWGVFNKGGTGLFYVACYKIGDDGKPAIDGRVPAPQECAGDWTKREWAVDAIKIYIARLDRETSEATDRSASKARNKAREADATVTGG